MHWECPSAFLPRAASGELLCVAAPLYNTCGRGICICLQIKYVLDKDVMEVFGALNKLLKK